MSVENTHMRANNFSSCIKHNHEKGHKYGHKWLMPHLLLSSEATNQHLVGSCTLDGKSISYNYPPRPWADKLCGQNFLIHSVQHTEWASKERKKDCREPGCSSGYTMEFHHSSAKSTWVNPNQISTWEQLNTPHLRQKWTFPIYRERQRIVVRGLFCTPNSEFRGRSTKSAIL